MTEKNYLRQRHEILFLYDIRMGNPNGDPNENRPRVLPDGKFYVTDVRLKRYIRDFLKMKGHDILVDTSSGKTTNLTGRVSHYLEEKKLKKVEGAELFNILVDSFIDARLFGSSFAFAEEKGDGKESDGTENDSKDSGDEENTTDNEQLSLVATDEGKKKGKGKGKKDKGDVWKPRCEPKTLTGAMQFNHGEVLHDAEEIEIAGTSVFSSSVEKTQGTFTNYYALRYGLIGFHGVANEHNAARSRMSEADYRLMLEASWKGVRSAANTRTKIGQIPHLLVSIRYKEGSEFQMGGLLHYIRLKDSSQKGEKSWESAFDYHVDLDLLYARLKHYQGQIDAVEYQISPDLQLVSGLPSDWKDLKLEG